MRASVPGGQFERTEAVQAGTPPALDQARQGVVEQHIGQTDRTVLQLERTEFTLLAAGEIRMWQVQGGDPRQRTQPFGTFEQRNQFIGNRHRSFLRIRDSEAKSCRGGTSTPPRRQSREGRAGAAACGSPEIKPDLAECVPAR